MKLQLLFYSLSYLPTPTDQPCTYACVSEPPSSSTELKPASSSADSTHSSPVKMSDWGTNEMEQAIKVNFKRLAAGFQQLEELDDIRKQIFLKELTVIMQDCKR